MVLLGHADAISQVSGNEQALVFCLGFADGGKTGFTIRSVLRYGMVVT
jgi:hypothetical protein